MQSNYSYTNIEHAKTLIRSLDVMVYKGGDGVSGCIGKLQKSRVKNGDFSHAGLVIWGRDLDVTGVDPDTLYSWEITMSGDMNDGIKDIYGNSFLGVQLRKFDDVCDAIFKSDGCICAWVPLRDRTLGDNDRIAFKENCTRICKETYGRGYEISPMVLLAALFPCFRKCFTTVGTHRFFCSEFVAWVLKEMGVADASLEETYVMPVDFIPYVDEDKAIKFTLSPVIIIKRFMQDPDVMIDIQMETCTESCPELCTEQVELHMEPHIELQDLNKIEENVIEHY